MNDDKHNGNSKSGAGHHRGRAFRSKRLKTTLPKPDTELALPQAKGAERSVTGTVLGMRRSVMFGTAAELAAFQREHGIAGKVLGNPEIIDAPA